MSWASAVTRYLISDLAASVSWNMPNRSPAPSTAAAYSSLNSGNGKSCSRSPPAWSTNAPSPVMKLAWWNRAQPGGSAKSGSPARSKFVATAFVRTAVGGVHYVHVDLEGGLDGRIGPLDFPRPPLVVDLGSGLAQDHVLDPVGCRPTRRGAGLDAQAPQRLGIALVGLALRQEVVPGRGRVVRVVVKTRVVPDQALDGGLDEDPVGCSSTFPSSTSAGEVSLS